MLLLILGLQIIVTFSTPTGDYTHEPANERRQQLLRDIPVPQLSMDLPSAKSSCSEVSGQYWRATGKPAVVERFFDKPLFP